MILFKGDTVRTSFGEIGEIVDIWGVARTFLRIKPEAGGKAIIRFDTQVELLKRPKSKNVKG